MAIETRPELETPSFVDFDLLKQAFLSLGDEPDALVRRTDRNYGVSIIVERLFVDTDFIVWPPLIVRLSGKIRTFSGGNKMVVRYREMACNPDTINNSLNHDYILATEGEEVVEFGHSIRAAPPMPELRQDHTLDDEAMTQAQEGSKLLRASLGNQLELTSGDCGVLFDRMLELQA